MIRLLGKRPFDRKDDMDKWLDENRPELVAPPPFERPETSGPQEGSPSPAATAIRHQLPL